MPRIANERICRTYAMTYTGRRRYNCSNCGVGISPGEIFVQDRIAVKEPVWNRCRSCAISAGFAVPDDIDEAVLLKEEKL